MNPRSSAARAQRNPAIQLVARLGYVVSGVLNLTIGALALGVVGAGASGAADPNGALSGIASAPGGLLLIWVTVIGFVALGLWQLTSALLVRQSDGAKRWFERAKLIGKGIAYLTLGVLGVRIALRGASGGGAEEDFTAKALATPGGVVLVVLVGLGALGIGGYLVAKGVRRTFLDDLDLPAGRAGEVVTVLGVAGYVARGIAIATIGVLFVVAGMTTDASRAGGLDDALAALAALPFGRVVLVVIAVGFLASGVYTFARARFARL